MVDYELHGSRMMVAVVDECNIGVDGYSDGVGSCRGRWLQWREHGQLW